jgi:hypothetical protein
MAQNVKVAVRCRPMSSKEMDRGCNNIATVSNAMLCLLCAAIVTIDILCIALHCIALPLHQLIYILFSAFLQITDTTIKLTGGDGAKNREFTFDCCYDDKSHQSQVYEDLGKNVIEKALEGYNGTIFACKTYICCIVMYCNII